MATQLDKTLAKFFSLEVIGIKSHDDDGKKAEVLALQQLHEKSYLAGGGYVMPFLFKSNVPILWNNQAIAMNHLLALEKKIDSQPNLMQHYVQARREYFERGACPKKSDLQC